MTFYTYLHRRADTNVVFYIGKGTGRRAWAISKRSGWWTRVFRKAKGRTVEVLAQLLRQATLRGEV